MQQDVKTVFENVWRVTHQVIVSQDKEMTKIVGYGSGFFFHYREKLFFVTADHVLHPYDHQVKKRLFGDYYVFVLNHIQGEGNKSACTLLGNFHYFEVADKDYLEELVSGKEILPDVEIPDYAFCEVENNFEYQFLTSEYHESDGSIIVPAGLEKMILGEKNIVEPNKEDYYVVGSWIKQHRNQAEAKIEMENRMHYDMKYVGVHNDMMVLAYPETVVYEEWAGISGSPVLNQNGQLLGVIVAVRKGTNYILVIPMKEVLKKMDYVLDIEEIENGNK